MTAGVAGTQATGLVGPVAVSGGLLLLLVSPIMRGGNSHAALIPLELIALALLLALCVRFAMAWRNAEARLAPQPLLSLLLLSPALFAVVQLIPVPAGLWSRLPGHAVYLDTLDGIRATAMSWRPVSVSPDATRAALLAGIPLVAAFLLAYLASLAQLRLLMRLVVAMAFAEVLLGLMQISGGEHSPLFFGVMSYGPPVGTFANRNHFANYVAMALAAYVWLAYEANRDAMSRRKPTSFGSSHKAAAWVAGSLVLVLGILMSRSRGAALFGLPMALIGLSAVSLRVIGWARGLRFAVPVTLLLVLAAAALIGFDAVTSRISGAQLAGSASFRSALALASLDAAAAFWPWGSGWGTYDLAVQRFQPASMAFYPNHAHMDYVEMLLEGGIFFALLAAMFLWLAGRRARLLVKLALRDRKLDREAMAATLCGLGLLGFLLHSLVEFNMRIPANAILACLLAGVYLRPLSPATLQ